MAKSFSRAKEPILPAFAKISLQMGESERWRPPLSIRVPSAHSRAASAAGFRPTNRRPQFVRDRVGWSFLSRASPTAPAAASPTLPTARPSSDLSARWFIGNSTTSRKFSSPQTHDSATPLPPRHFIQLDRETSAAAACPVRRPKTVAVRRPFPDR